MNIFSSPMKVIVDKNMLLQISEYVKGMQKQVNEMKITFDKVADENTKLKSEFEKKNDEIQKLKKEITDLCADRERMMNSFNSEKNDQNQQISNLKKQIDGRDSDISCLRIKSENNERRMASEIKDKIEEINHLKNIIREKESAIDNYRKNYVCLYDKGNYDKVNIISNDMSDDKRDFSKNLNKAALNLKVFEG